MSSAFYLPLSIVLSVAVIYDFFNTVRRKPGLGEASFTLRSISNAANYISIVLLLAVILLNLYVNRMIKDPLMLYLAYWMFLLLARSILYLAKTGGLYKSGIWFSGRFYSWEDIRAFYCDKNTGRVGLAITKQLFGLKYGSKLRLQAHKSQIGEINEFLFGNIKD